MESSITIDRDVAVPEFREAGAKYPWRELEVRESFFVPDRSKAQMAAYCRSVGKRIGRTFRCVDDVQNGKEGCRVFRTA